MVLVDSHCHLDLLTLEEAGSVAQVIERAKALDVQHFLCVGITLQDFAKVLAIAERYPEVSASVGLHPNEIVDTEPTVATLVKLAEHPKVVAIGETGLDYFRSAAGSDWQRERFRTHIHAAKTIGKPLIIHSRQAKEDTLRILREEQAGSGVLHCFTEDWEMAKQAIDLGLYISFSGIVTFQNAKAIQTVAKQLPLERMLVETDSPFLAPVPYRGKPNEPAYVRHVAEFIARLRGIDIVELAEATTRNFFKLISNT